MSSIVISSIVSVDEKRGIGKTNKLPWDIPKDRKWFKEKTVGHVVIMGRNTFHSIVDFLGKPLPERTNIVVTSSPDQSSKDVHFVNNIEEALELGKKLEKNGELFFIGGAKIYAASLPYVKRLYVTQIKGKFDCDALFPDYSEFKKVVFSEENSDNGFDFTFKILEK